MNINEDILKEYLKLTHWFLDDIDAQSAVRFILTTRHAISLIGYYEIMRDGSTDTIIGVTDIVGPVDLEKDEYDDNRPVYIQRNSGVAMEHTTVIHIPENYREEYIKLYRELQLDSLI